MDPTTEVFVARQTTGQSAPEAESEARPASADELWSAVRIDPVEIALPKGVGYTLRAYRAVTDVTPTDISEREEEAFPDRHRPIQAEADEEEDEFDLDDEEEEDDDRHDDEEEEDEFDEDEDDAEDEDEEEAAAAAEPEEVPVFLGRAGRLYLFRSPEGLVEYVRSSAEHDLSQLDTWSELVEKISVDDVVPLAEDSYELDLVVENLRGSRDQWDANLVIQAGEVARDLGYALRIDPIVSALSAGSPLDDLDEALRATESGGLGSFFARRKLKKIGAEAAPLGWRTIIGKISSVVDWRD
ncbi:MAG: DNA primase [Actinobacteria bacterium 13_2_20CM_2_71_6]|nr:MAG: DNA primase [Actinobacteria bacterium 13_2_20CM_2_71_6]